MFGIWFLINWLSCPKARHFIGHPICTHSTDIYLVIESTRNTHTHTRSFISFHSELANGDQQRDQLVCVCVCTMRSTSISFSLTFRIELTNCQHACCLATGVANIFQLNVCGEIKLQNLTIYWQTHKFDLVLGLHLLGCVKYDCSCTHTHRHIHLRMRIRNMYINCQRRH